MNERTFHYLKTTLLLMLLCLIITGCSMRHDDSRTCQILFCEDDALWFETLTRTVVSGDDSTFTIGLPHGYVIDSVSYSRYTVSDMLNTSDSYDYYDITLHDIRYSCYITIDIKEAVILSYDCGDTTIELPCSLSHLRQNTLSYSDLASLNITATEGCLITGWNTEEDGSGLHIGLGSRVDTALLTEGKLYLETIACTDADSLSYEINDDSVTITGYKGDDDLLVIPDYIEGLPVRGIAAGAISDTDLAQVYLPETLTYIEVGAFEGISITDLTIPDTISDISDASFINCSIATLHINAATAPRYSGTYFDSYPDKVDYLSSISHESKIVLISGSSTRFDYNSPSIDEAFRDYDVANMGVYAYADMTFEYEIAEAFMNAGDLLIVTPELDSIDCQFCIERAFSYETYAMCEANYDIISLLDISTYSHVFDALRTFNENRAQVEEGSYDISVKNYDEDHNLTSDASYNSYGDYCLYRKDNESREIFGIKRAYYNKKYITEDHIAAMNSLLDDFAGKGITVFYNYSPRSELSLSADTDAESIAALDSYLKDNIHATFLSDAEDSIMDALYFYGTDNHLSTNGAEFFTDAFIWNLHSMREVTE